MVGWFSAGLIELFFLGCEFWVGLLIALLEDGKSSWENNRAEFTC